VTQHILYVELFNLHKTIMETYRISKTLLNKVFINLINSDSIKNSANKNAITHILLKDLPESSIESIIHLGMTDEFYQPLAIGDHFKTKPINYHVSKHYESDILCDMGLCDGEGNIFGYVVRDGGWSSTDYNPFYSTLKVKLYYHDKNMQVIEFEESLTPLELTKIDKLDIPYFNKPDFEKPITNQLTFEPF